MSDDITIDDAFANAISEVESAAHHVNVLRQALRYRTLTTKDADKIRRMTLGLNTNEQTLMQLRDIAAARLRREGTLA